MTIRHHASDETLLRLAAGHLPPGPALVVQTHLAGCPDCRARLKVFEAVGGALLDEMPPERMSSEAFARVMARIDASPQPRPGAAPRARRAPPAMPEGMIVPKPLRDCEIGPWRWFGPGIRISRVEIPGAPKAGVSLLRVGAGRKLPEHGHSGIEFTQLLHGSFSDAFGRYLPGDLAEMGADVDHEPVVDPDGDCICLAALEGEMVLRGLMGRLIQPFARI
ncbi:ChrR family anti-sigma-E factor [Aquabacter spiritensis]|uniref:ChrR-like anti-ECFsigma factor n=1 Tax=Aquabacter spiritensis TaxID=933073 RepID=A0A4R3M605_9HYPH|nr:ChrR family anti-sigma-E factor [Aquabacter spiritensis]TCT06927.1 ChrR-like anti-ECFsigma factor [Aquabacter spiritensis]